MTAVFLPDVSGLTPDEAALAFARCGLPVVPFDPGHGNGKSCWNLLGYRDVTTDLDRLGVWRTRLGPFRALATSPGAFGCLVLDVDTPAQFPKPWRTYLDNASVPFVATRPAESQRRGHYWFTLPPALALNLGNPAFGWGEVRCKGGGVVLPPYGDRAVVRPGVPPVLPDQLTAALLPYAAKAGAGEGTVSVQQFVADHRDNRRPHKLPALLNLRQSLLNRGRSPHDAMRETLRVGLGEARVGYVPAKEVVGALRDCWDREPREFDGLVRWAVQVAQAADPHALQLVSDRARGTDTREYGGLVPPVRYAGQASETTGSTTT